MKLTVVPPIYRNHVEMTSPAGRGSAAEKTSSGPCILKNIPHIHPLSTVHVGGLEQRLGYALFYEKRSDSHEITSSVLFPRSFFSSSQTFALPLVPFFFAWDTMITT